MRCSKPKNAPSPIVVSVSGSVREMTVVQSLNAYLSKEVSPSANVIEESLEHVSKADSPTEVSVQGSVRDRMYPYPLKAARPIDVTPGGTVMVRRERMYVLIPIFIDAGGTTMEGRD